jgi:hypothetical protein
MPYCDKFFSAEGITYSGRSEKTNSAPSYGAGIFFGSILADLIDKSGEFAGFFKVTSHDRLQFLEDIRELLEISLPHSLAAQLTDSVFLLVRQDHKSRVAPPPGLATIRCIL